MSSQYDKDAWRQHRVPTFIDLEDTVFGGLSWTQIVGVVISALSGFGIYMILGAMPTMARFVIAGIIGILLCGIIGIRPGGRSLYILMGEWLAFKLGPRYYGDEVRRLVSRNTMAEGDRRRGKGGLQIRIRVPLTGRAIWLNFFLRIPFKQKRSQISVGCLLAVLAVSAVTSGCSMGKVSAQVPEEYAGKRLYLQSVVTNLDYNINVGGRSATVAVKAAAPLEQALVRVNENTVSVQELNANRTRVGPAVNKSTGTTIMPVAAIDTGDEFIFNRIFLGDQLNTRPYCDIHLGGDGFYLNPDISPPQYRFRYHSKDCRIRPAYIAGGEPLSPEDTISKPFVSINWIDRKQNQGALSIDKAMLPFPDPHIESVALETIDVNTGEILNINEMCNMADVRVMSMGIQSERPSSIPPAGDYFDGRSGRRIAGVVRVCPLEASHRIARVILPRMPVFAAGVTDYEIWLRPYAETLKPEDIVSRATVRVRDGNGSQVFEGQVAKMGDPGFNPLQPNILKFNVAPPYYEPKVFTTDLDTVTLQIEVEVEHAIKAIRPVHQPIQFWPKREETHITACGCSRSGGSCNAGGRCRCSCRSRTTSAVFLYWEDHYRVDEADKQFLPTDPSAEIVMVFKQTMLFEMMKFTFDRAYEEFIYVTPTPEPGELREAPYHDDGDTIGLWDGDPLICSDAVGYDSEGRWTGWVWVETGVNSQGEAYGGCRRAYGCKLHIPVVEEPFGAGGTPTEADYECVKQR